MVFGSRRLAVCCAVALEVFLEHVYVGPLVDVLEGLFLDLSYALAGEPHGLRHFFGGAGALSEAEEHFEDGALSVGEALECCAEVGGERLALHVGVGGGRVVVGHVVDHGAGVVVLVGCVDRHFLAGAAQRERYLLDVGVDHFCQFLYGGLALAGLPELVARLVELALEADLVEGFAHDAALFGDGLEDALANPPHGVGDVSEAECLVKFLGGAYESDVAFLDEVAEFESLVAVLLCHADYEAEVGVDEFSLCLLVAFVDSSCEFYFLFIVDHWNVAQFAEIAAHAGCISVCELLCNFKLAHIVMVKKILA